MYKITFYDQSKWNLSAVFIFIFAVASAHFTSIQAQTPNLIEGIERTVGILDAAIDRIENSATNATLSLKEKIRDLEQKLLEKKEKFEDGIILDTEEEKREAEESFREASNETFESAKALYLELNDLLRKLQNDNRIKELTKNALEAKIKLNEAIQDYYNDVSGTEGLGYKILSELETYAKGRLSELAVEKGSLLSAENILEEKNLEFLDSKNKERIQAIERGLSGEEALPLEQRIHNLNEEIKAGIKGDSKMTIEKIRNAIQRLQLMIKFIQYPTEIQSTTKNELSGFSKEEEG